MTNEEAIETLKQLILQGADERLKHDYEAIGLAIKALERPQGDIHDFIAKADEGTLFQLKKEIENALTKIAEQEAYEEAREEAMKLDEADGTLKGRGFA